MTDLNNTSPNPQSFVPYTGKAPAIIQIIGGLLWLGAAGLILYGLLGLLLNPTQGVIVLVIAVLFIVSAQSLFKMKKTAFRNSIILVILFVIQIVYSFITNPQNPHYFNLVYPVVFSFIAFYYKDRFVN